MDVEHKEIMIGRIMSYLLCQYEKVAGKQLTGGADLYVKVYTNESAESVLELIGSKFVDESIQVEVTELDPILISADDEIGVELLIEIG